jgi:hypothetical protein
MTPPMIDQGECVGVGFPLSLSLSLLLIIN